MGIRLGSVAIANEASKMRALPGGVITRRFRRQWQCRDAGGVLGAAKHWSPLEVKPMPPNVVHDPRVEAAIARALAVWRLLHDAGMAQ